MAKQETNPRSGLGDKRVKVGSEGKLNRKVEAEELKGIDQLQGSTINVEGAGGKTTSVKNHTFGFGNVERQGVKGRVARNVVDEGLQVLRGVGEKSSVISKEKNRQRKVNVRKEIGKVRDEQSKEQRTQGITLRSAERRCEWLRER